METLLVLVIVGGAAALLALRLRRFLRRDPAGGGPSCPGGCSCSESSHCDNKARP